MIKLGEAVEYMFQLGRFSSGAVYAATGTPVGTVYKNGVADALSVTCTIVSGAGEVGLWKAVFTPTSGAGFAAADHVALRVTATVDGVAGGGIVWQDRIDSADLTDVNAKTTNLPASPAAVGSAMTLASGAITAAAISDAALTKLCKIVGTKKIINAAGTQVQIYDAAGVLLVTLDRTGSGPYTWTPTWA
jgi:hypothetical protein